MSLREAWDAEAENWVRWARDRRDSYWRFHAQRFFELLPPPCSTLDIGCGEGRLPRDLKARGYSVVAVDSSEALIAHARASDPEGDYRVANATALPLAGESVPLVTAFMVLHDVDDMPGVIREASRVLAANGHLCMAFNHPMSSAGRFEEPGPDAPFVTRRSYFEHRRWASTLELDELRMTFHAEHRPIADYVAAIASAGLLVERLLEIPDTTAPEGSHWRRVPLFLQLRAIKLDDRPASAPRAASLRAR